MESPCYSMDTDLTESASNSERPHKIVLAIRRNGSCPTSGLRGRETVRPLLESFHSLELRPDPRISLHQPSPSLIKITWVAVAELKVAGPCAQLLIKPVMAQTHLVI
ncbi:MAG: hypothetical protein Ct9H300mP11_04630 [Chloroflexota bacterium]|nr:MAG: hypothetical protein Ct9H300mP11_04630 [Chloroflexota bacterium]